MNKIPIYKPLLKNYKKSVIDAINSEWISNHGKYIDLATNKLKEITNIKNIILMNNGTTATHCLFISLKYLYPQIKKIYIPNNVYIAVYNCALMEYLKEDIEIMKIDKDTWNICEEEEYIKSLDKNSAIVIVHNIGNIIDVDKIKKIRPDIILVEDNCEGQFGKYNDKYTGSNKNILCSSVSFYGNKTITTGEGGAFFTENKELYNYIKKVYSQGMTNTRFIHDVHAYNYRMTNIQAAFLYDQLCDIENILYLKEKVYNNYIKIFENEIKNGKITLQKVHKNCIHSKWMFGIKLKKEINFKEIEEYFLKNNIEIRPFFYPFFSHEHIKDIKSHSNHNESIELNKKIIILPSFPEILYEEQIYIYNILKNII